MYANQTLRQQEQGLIYDLQLHDSNSDCHIRLICINGIKSLLYIRNKILLGYTCDLRNLSLYFKIIHNLLFMRYFCSLK